MERDDLERRVAELERQLAEQKRYAGATRRAGSGGQLSSTLIGDRRLSVLAVLGISLLAAILVTMLLPSSALWTSGIVCDSGSRLAYSESFGLGQGTTMTFQCVSGDASYGASKLAIYALQALVAALVVPAAIAVARLTWRRSGLRWLAVAVLVVGLVVPLALDLAVVGKWQDSSGAIQVPQGGSLSVDELLTTKSIACNDGNLRVGGFFMTVAVSGHCRRLTVDGIGDHVSFDTVDSNIGGGIGNTVEHR
jgi:hypothetical protein